MDSSRFASIIGNYPRLSIAVLGDFCLDRYLEIDPSRREISLETQLPVHNVVNVRSQPGGAGTILNNLAALGVGTIYPLGFAGEDGEGFELWEALQRRPGVRMNYFVKSAQRKTFTYCKPLVMEPGKPPLELNRLDVKNWTPTPTLLQGILIGRVEELVHTANAIIVLDQVDIPETGVVTTKILDALRKSLEPNPNLLVLADSRRGLRGFPPLIFKMNATELSAMTGRAGDFRLEEIRNAAAGLAARNRRMVFVTLSERGILGATPNGQVEHIPALPVKGEIDIVGAGDAVSANLTAAMAAGASLREALEIANAAASVVVHKLGTTGTANPGEIEARLREAHLLEG